MLKYPGWVLLKILILQLCIKNRPHIFYNNKFDSINDFNLMICINRELLQPPFKWRHLKYFWLIIKKNIWRKFEKKNWFLNVTKIKKSVIMKCAHRGPHVCSLDFIFTCVQTLTDVNANITALVHERASDVKEWATLSQSARTFRFLVCCWYNREDELRVRIWRLATSQQHNFLTETSKRVAKRASGCPSE